MYKCLVSVLILVCSVINIQGQGASVTIGGRVVDEVTGECVSYAVVRTREGQCGTIANEYGFFQLNITNGSTRVIIQSIGYINLEIVAAESKDYGDIKLRQRTMELNEVNIRPKDSSFLFDLIESCRTGLRSESKTTKACFELKSYSSGKQIELIEAYYNATQKQCRITDLVIKTGRLALQPHDQRYFLSLDGSHAITSMKVFEHNNAFPATPLEFSSRKSRDLFYLHQEDMYIDENKDTVIVIEFNPRDTSVSLFSGHIHINTRKKLVLKSEMNCSQCKTHPFIPIFPDDEAASVDMHLKRIFNADQSTKQINFHYRVNYISRPDFQSTERTSFYVDTYALMHFYDDNHMFFEPMFQYPDNLDDYRMLNALPYNDFFWKTHTDLQMDVNRKTNDQFFFDQNSITNLEVFNNNEEVGRKLLKYPFVPWSESRIRISDAVSDLTERAPGPSTISEMYHLEAQLFFDATRIGDSLDICTRAILDPYKSYYHLSQDTLTMAFINIYFDLCEMHRREMHDELLASSGNDEALLQIYHRFTARHEHEMQEYLKRVDRGTNKTQLKYYNDFVMEKLGINNFHCFGINAE